MTQTALKERVRPSLADLVARAEELVPVVAARAAATEKSRKVPDETIAAFEKAGFYRILQPARFGGYEMHPTALFEVVMTIARGCPSSAWCLSVVCIHNWEVALLDPQMAEDIWGDDDSVRLSSSYAPFGKVERTDGGYLISGRWPFSSGADHCDWAILGGIAPGEPGAPVDQRSFIIPRSDYTIEDTWHVIGLQGTGSNDIVVERAFVPEYRTHKFIDSFLQMDPGTKTFTAPSYRYPFGIVFVHCLASVTLGMAEGAREAFIEQMKVRLGAYDYSKASEDPFVRQRLAHADSLIRSQRALFAANWAEMDAFVERGEPLPIELRARIKFDAQNLARSAMQAIDLLFKAAGGRGIRDDNPLQRFFRDVQAATNHAFLNAEKGAVNAGGVLLGAPTADYSI